MAIVLLLATVAAAAPLTLAEALELAERHPTAVVAEARLEQARSDRAVAWSAFGPQVSVTGTYTRRPTEVTAGEALLQAQDALRTSGRADLTVVDLSAAASVVASGTGVRAQEQASDELTRALGYDVAGAFVDVLATERVVDAAERRAAVAAELVRAAEARLQAGVATANDVTRTALEEASADLAVVEARGQVAAARVRLAAMLGLDELGALEPPELVVDEPARPIPAIAALELQAKQARQEARATNLGYLPALGVFGTALATNEAGFSGRANDWSAGALASWELFDGARRLQTARRLRAVGTELDATADELERQYTEALGRARADVATAEAALEVARRRVGVAEANVAELRERFAVGLASALEVSDAVASAYEAESEAALQQLELERARLRLAEAMGLRAEELL